MLDDDTYLGNEVFRWWVEQCDQIWRNSATMANIFELKIAQIIS